MCAHNCHNTIGSYNCSCNIGYRLNMDGFGCDDINECVEETDQCNQNCHNTIGSYTCSCYTGFRLGPNNFTCLGKLHDFILSYTQCCNVMVLIFNIPRH